MTYFHSCTSLNEAKATYKTLAMQFHPDRNLAGDATAIMQQINNEYAFIIAKLANSSRHTTGETFTAEEVEAEILNAEQYKEALNAVINLQGIIIELCGGWLWISGNTYPLRSKLSAAGFYWANAKKMWYFRTVEYATKNRKTHTMEEIRTKYGSQVIAGASYRALV